jgi:hypothetical protein
MKITALLLLSLLPGGHQLDGSETVQETPVVVSTVSELTKALEDAKPGETIYLRGGTYRCPTTMTIARSGSASAPIRLFAYPSDATRPRLDFSTLAENPRHHGLLLQASYWHLKGLMSIKPETTAC